MVFAHGVGGSADLPLPLPLALAGGAAALAVSFIVLALAWRSPRFEAATQGRPLPGWLSRALTDGWLSAALRVLGLGVTAYVVWAALAGPDNLANPTFGVVYVVLWVGLVPASLLFGPVYKAVNPLRTLHAGLRRLTGGDSTDGIWPLPSWVGLWPAALGLLAFVWLELVFPDGNYLWSLQVWFGLYAAIVVAGALLLGERWIAAADPFEAYSTLVGRLSCFGRRGDGRLVARNPLSNLDATPAQPGLLAVVAVLVGSTMFDSFQSSLAWLRVSADAPLAGTVLDTLTLVAFCVVVGGLFAAATLATPPVAGVDRRHLPMLFAHSVVPIVVGYAFAHYLSSLVEAGQQTLIYLSDPMVDGSNYLGTADLQVNYWLTLHPTVLAVTKVVAIVGGHVLGVVAAHDRAMKLLPRRDQLIGQLPLLMVMVVYTVAGLYLLLSV